MALLKDSQKTTVEDEFRFGRPELCRDSGGNDVLKESLPVTE
jgi:hypothetical protein